MAVTATQAPRTMPISAIELPPNGRKNKNSGASAWATDNRSKIAHPKRIDFISVSKNMTPLVIAEEG